MAITAWLCAIGTATFAMTTLASVVFAQVALASTAPTNIPDTIDAAPADTTRRMDSLQVHVSEPLPLTGRFRGATRAYCSSFMITEWGLNANLSGGPRDAADWWLTGEFGWMWNLAANAAVGAVFFAAFNKAAGLLFFSECAEDGSREGFKVRYRRWVRLPSGDPKSMNLELSAGLSVELSAGLLVFGSARYDSGVFDIPDDPSGEEAYRDRFIQYPTPMLSAGFNVGDLVSITSQVEWIRLDHGESDLAWSTGFRLCSTAGLFAFLATIGVIGGVAASM